MEEKTIIDNLTQDKVTIKRQKITTVDGIEYSIGQLWAKAYENSKNGRKELQTEVAEPY